MNIEDNPIVEFGKKEEFQDFILKKIYEEGQVNDRVYGQSYLSTHHDLTVKVGKEILGYSEPELTTGMLTDLAKAYDAAIWSSVMDLKKRNLVWTHKVGIYLTEDGQKLARGILEDKLNAAYPKLREDLLEAIGKLTVIQAHKDS